MGSAAAAAAARDGPGNVTAADDVLAPSEGVGAPVIEANGARGSRTGAAVDDVLARALLVTPRRSSSRGVELPRFCCSDMCTIPRRVRSTASCRAAKGPPSRMSVMGRPTPSFQNGSQLHTRETQELDLRRQELAFAVRSAACCNGRVLSRVLCQSKRQAFRLTHNKLQLQGRVPRVHMATWRGVLHPTPRVIVLTGKIL